MLKMGYGTAFEITGSAQSMGQLWDTIFDHNDVILLFFIYILVD